MEFIKFIQVGGFFMYPIMLVFFAGMAIFFERLYALGKARARSREIWSKVQPDVQAGRLETAFSAVKDDTSEAGRILDYGLGAAASGADMPHVEGALEEGLLEVIPRLEARTSYIATLANVATLLGLLGTVHGLILAFASVANADPAQKGDLLSAALAVSMNTTAFGLGAAIPLVLAFTFLQNYTQQVIESLEMIAMKVQNSIRRTFPTLTN
ncbi:MotA/TolQ/ExbB proton channel family protein [Aquirhabdus parva]|uniref:MotA/TolQ/ExbB proton channel family protein n=1 Tax=Aquirhabdus parva TaxID=2283318 RepID=A0A345P486_9GAMM|nr:MotA/TolQ/ExbB proton channel family protein [Aquirhabdus parva]AXI02095.1 MotA/TolQ/ExbB proton channel family protein [Aquirhabdus parva]